MVKDLVSHVRRYLLLYIGLIIHVLFYVSAIGPGWLNVFFSDAQTHHGAAGTDFLQVVRGAWAWWHGGSLTGAPVHGAMYAPAIHYFVNGNVYGPLFTLTIGSVLMLIPPAMSFSAWIVMKGCIDAWVLWYFWREFRHEKYAQLAMFLLLANMDAYLELATGQYHFLLNVALLLMLVLLHKNQHVGATVVYIASLLIKPVGLLFIPVLALKKHWRMAFIALDVLIAATVPLVLSRAGLYYVGNLWGNIVHPVQAGPSQIITLNALLRFSTNWPDAVYKAIQYGCLALVMLMSASRRTHVNKAVFLCIVYFLLFYDLLFEYDWSTLVYVGAMCLLALPEFQTRISRALLVLLCLPSCFVIFRLLHIGILSNPVYGDYANVFVWRFVALSKLVPALLLCASVMAGDVRFWAKWVILSLRKARCGRHT